MSQLVCFLEEPSAREMLKGLLPKVLPENTYVQYVVFEGKQDLEKRLPKRLKNWQIPDTKFLVLRDQDSGNCKTIKENLVKKCADAGKPQTVVRIACHELESFYLGDLKAVAQAIGPAEVQKMQTKSKFRKPDELANPAEELKKLAPEYQKVSGSRAIGPLLDIQHNTSDSFNILVKAITKLFS
ncbi:MAG: DUF4276 family protein [Methylocystaceae bacterium]|nr:DUF4276 family protein [Methylocystaceae bacterium]